MLRVGGVLACPAIEARRSSRRRRGRALPSSPAAAKEEALSSGDAKHRSLSSGGDWSLQNAPWSIGAYYTKRTGEAHRPDVLGGIAEEDIAHLAAPPGWTAAGKMTLATKIVAAELGLSEQAVTLRLAQLQELLPDLSSRFASIKPGDLARLAASLPDVALQLVRLRDIFPHANISKMVSRRINLLSMPTEEVASRAAALRELLGPRADDAAAVQPSLLDIDATKAALSELDRLMPAGSNTRQMLVDDPSLLTAVETGPRLITCACARHSLRSELRVPDTSQNDLSQTTTAPLRSWRSLYVGGQMLRRTGGDKRSNEHTCCSPRLSNSTGGSQREAIHILERIRHTYPLVAISKRGGFSSRNEVRNVRSNIYRNRYKSTYTSHIHKLTIHCPYRKIKTASGG